MGVEALARDVTIALFIMLFTVVMIRASRQRNRVWVETSLFFACATLVVGDFWALREIGLRQQRLLAAVGVTLVVVMAFLLGRLINYMSAIPRSVLHVTDAGFVILIVVSFTVSDVDSPAVILPVVTYFAAVVVFTAVVTASEGIRSSGVTRRRLLAVAIGSLFLTLAVMLSGIRAAFPGVAGIYHSLINGPLALAAGVSYFVGFATPNFLRRAWQDQVLREFFTRTAALPRLSDQAEIVFALETRVRRAMGGAAAWIGLWDAAHQVLRFPTRSDGIKDLQPGQMIEGRVITRQRPMVSVNLIRDDAVNAELYRALGVNAVIGVPIAVGDRMFGVLSVYSARASVFFDDDVEVVRLLADQVAMILESHALIEQSTQLRAREEATRLKDDFLATAAHDLTNPLAVLIMQAQMLDRQARRQPTAPIDRDAVKNLVDQANRLQVFVSDLLDVQRVESQGLTIDPEEIDLGDLITQAVGRLPPGRHTVVLEVRTPAGVVADRTRMVQVIDNLLSNAVKYSPDGGEIRVLLWRERDDVHLTVRDHGIGIPADDLPHVFERFHRAGNTEKWQLRGVGLGLYICRAVVEAHGGTISVASELGRGSEFHIVLPADRLRSARSSRPHIPATPPPIEFDPQRSLSARQKSISATHAGQRHLYL